MSATKTEPTDEQLRAYADKLPAIYRDVLAAFPGESSNRRAGDGLYLSSIASRFQEIMPADYRPRDLARAMAQLEGRGFITRASADGTPPNPFITTAELVQDYLARAVGDSGHDPFVAPTPLGERLITVLTGHQPVERDIPPLPEPTWG